MHIVWSNLLITMGILIAVVAVLTWITIVAVRSYRNKHRT